MRAIKVYKNDLNKGDKVALVSKPNNHGIHWVYFGEIDGRGTSITLINAVKCKMQFTEVLERTNENRVFSQFLEYDYFVLPPEGSTL